MVYFTVGGLQKLKNIVLGEEHVQIVGGISEVFDELSVIMTKINFIIGENTQSLFINDDSGCFIGNAKGKEPIVIEAKDIFQYFECTYTPFDDTMKVPTSSVVYHKVLGEVMEYNPILDMYVCNDGMKIKSSLVPYTSTIALSAKAVATCMPDYHAMKMELSEVFAKRLKALKLSKLVVGSKVKIRTYNELAKKFGQQFIVVDENDEYVSVDATDDKNAVGYIPKLGYTSLSGKYYTNKIGVVTHIDELSGVLTIDIDGHTSHTKFIDENGEVSDHDDDAVLFTVDMVKLAVEKE